LTIAAQVLLGAPCGGAGVALVLVKMLYVEDVFGDHAAAGEA
jgi:hypothetical protein